MRNAILCGVLAVALCSCSVAPTPPPAAPGKKAAAPATLRLLHAQGRSIVDPDGRTVSLRGCNSGSWLLIEPWIIGWELPEELQFEKSVWDLLGQRFGEADKLNLIKTFRTAFFTRADVQRIADNGMNCLRIPIWWRAVSDPAYGGDMAYLDNCIRWCKEAGVYAIIDLHGAPGGQCTWACAGEPNHADLWKDEKYRAQTVAWWTGIATRYKDEPAVAGFDLLNESAHAPMDELMRFYDRLYKAIRAVDGKHILIMEDGTQGFHRLAHPSQMGWSNVVYSFHYYPQTSAEGVQADSRTFLKYNRAAVYYGVPVLVGEFNIVDLSRGGADSFRRYMEVFDYYGWAWTFWTFKRLDANRDQFWGLYGVVDSVPEVDLHADSPEKLTAAFDLMRTEATRVNAPLQAILQEPPRRFPDLVGSETAPGGITLALKDAIILRPGTNDTIRLEWGYDVPDAQYWAKGDRIAWPVNIATDATYDLRLVLSNTRQDNDVAVWVDGVHVMTVPVGKPSGGWTRYVEHSVGALSLKTGKHVVELSHGRCDDPYINLRGAVLTPTGGQPAKPEEDAVRLDAVNMDIPPSGSPLCIQWLYDPAAIGYWRAGEKATWRVNMEKGGEYAGVVTYASPNSGTVFRVLIDGTPVAKATLALTGNWWEYRTASLGSVTMAPGVHEVAIIWDGANPDGCGNLGDVMFTRP